MWKLYPNGGEALKKIFISLIIVGVTTVSFLFIKNYETEEEKEARQKLEAKLGNALFKYWVQYDDMTYYNPRLINIESVREIKQKLTTAEPYAKEIDEIVQHDLLHNINQNLYQMMNKIEMNYNDIGGFTSIDYSNYGVFASEVETTLDLVTDIYYAEGGKGKATTKIKNFDELIEINERLNEINSRNN